MKILSNLKANALGALNDSRADGLKTCALGDSNNPNSPTNKRGVLNTLKTKGFTLAEVLITLTIIGVVAALTIPSLLANVSDKTYDAKRKGLATRMAQAIAQIDAINAYEDETDAEANSSMKFVVEALSKAYKISNVCEIENYAACDFAYSVRRYNANYMFSPAQDYPKLTDWNTSLTSEKLGGFDPKGVALKTKNGESMLLYYNPRCVAKQDEVDEETGAINSAQEMCVHIVYDLDGAKKGPNKFGNDIGPMTIFYSDTPYLVAPGVVVLTGQSKNYLDSESYCAGYTGGNFGKGELGLPSKEDVLSWGLSYKALYNQGSTLVLPEAWTSNVEGSDVTDEAWVVNPLKLESRLYTKDTSAYVLCNKIL